MANKNRIPQPIPSIADTVIWPPLPLTAEQLAEKWQPGAILHCNNSNTFSRLIIKSLTQWQRRLVRRAGIPWKGVRAYASHDAICCYMAGYMGFGEMLARSGGTWTSLEQYQRKIASGESICWLLWPSEAKPVDGTRAGNNWYLYGACSPYDYLAFFRLFIKALFFEVSDKAAGWKWAHWCTESVKDCWLHAGFNIYDTKNPTPLTTDHRCGFNWSATHKINLEVL